MKAVDYQYKQKLIAEDVLLVTLEHYPTRIVLTKQGNPIHEQRIRNVLLARLSSKLEGRQLNFYFSD